MAAPPKTPYQGRNQCEGSFTCDFGHRWTSQWSWANCGQRCGECLAKMLGKRRGDLTKKDVASQGQSIRYTYPFHQARLSADIYLSCNECSYEEEAISPKKRKCPMDNCQGSLLPWNYLKCPHCKYEHEWPEDKKTAQRLQFACNVYAEEGKGCDKVIGLGKGWKKAGKAGPHPDPLCEKCVQLGYKCTSHGKGKKKKPPTGSVNPCAVAPSVGSSVNRDVNNNNEVSPSLETKNRNKRRPRRKSSVKQDADVVNELCQILEKL